jgi:eukaryotic-like serine/threonine-protein kinase
MSDSYTAGNTPATGSFPGDAEAPAKVPRAIGRYSVIGLLGQGGFGIVYLAQDEQLGRLVAIKVPHARQVAHPGDVENHLREARTVAGLDHPHIVPVYDVGSSRDCPFFVVSKHIDGRTLSERLRAGRYTPAAAAELVAAMAECLHYAHRQGLVHRDVKPGNILIDKTDKPFLTDFGLALLETEIGSEHGYCGTPAYMSPEQARGEGHRVDGRSDIFSLGIVFYELLTGRRPFRGETGSVLADQIVNEEPKPPRQIADVPRELERICLRALSKRAADRYPTARDLADDLRHFLNSEANVKSEVSLPPETATGPSDKPANQITPAPAPSTLSAGPRAHIVPKGLRSFDEHDADFFLDLLPGPRDRTGLPESIRFWKSRIEATSPESTFTVGLIYGPSGCGKSSLLKAGLLPRLSESIASIYIEATPEGAEQRLLRHIRNRWPMLSDQLTLTESLTALRRAGAKADKKVLIILDQFEQWLHAWNGESGELVQALRQCDGDHVQCLVLVRDDFYAAVNRFFQKLETPIQEDRNYALVDLFDLDHAKKVLTAFGRAYGRLPEPPAPLTVADRTFLSRAIEGLSQGGRVISVRLALFAEMMKGRDWTVATLNEVGGPEGVGATFLEETFSSPAAPPTHRVHQAAARAVLQELLPAAGTDIRGQMQRADRLRAVSGYADRPEDFRTLLAILESDVRLIAPTEPAAAPTSDEPAAKYYQLTHDYLVPAIRTWLTQKQQGTPEGRARLLLAERAALWAAKPEVKQLPSGLEWLTIIWRTRRARWSVAERRLMTVATRRHVRHMAAGAAAMALIALLAVGFRGQWRRLRDQETADHLVNQLLVADVSRVADVAAQLDKLPGDWRSRLEAVASDSHRDNAERLRAHLALARHDSESMPFLIEQLSTPLPHEFVAIRTALEPRAAQCRPLLWDIATDSNAPAEQRFHAAAALAEWDPANERWKTIAAPTAAALVRQNPLVAPDWTRLLRPARKQLLQSLISEFKADRSRESPPLLAAGILADYAADDPDLLADVLQEASVGEFPILFSAAKPQAPRSTEIFQAVLAAPAQKVSPNIHERTRRRANAAVALFLLGRQEAVGSALSQDADPDLRTALIDLLPALVDFEALWPLSRPPSGDLTRQAVILAADGYRANGKLSMEARRQLEIEVPDLFLKDESAAVHSAAELLLRRLGLTPQLDKLSGGLAGKPRASWWLTSTGHTLALVRGPVDFEIGSPDDEPRRDDTEGRRPRHIERSYAIGTHEVTIGQFNKFYPNHRVAWDVAESDECPANNVSWYDAARYCRRLSEAEQIPEKEMVFPRVEDIDRSKDLVLPADWQRRTGYRLPTEAEWEYACRAGTTTVRYFGATDDALSKNAWWFGNSDSRTWPVGSLRPNPFGLFDMLGNVGEWCFDRPLSYAESEGDALLTINSGQTRVYRGGDWKSLQKEVRSAKRPSALPYVGFSNQGFRVVRTVRPATP